MYLVSVYHSKRGLISTVNLLYYFCVCQHSHIYANKFFWNDNGQFDLTSINHIFVPRTPGAFENIEFTIGLPINTVNLYVVTWYHGLSSPSHLSHNRLSLSTSPYYNRVGTNRMKFNECSALPSRHFSGEKKTTASTDWSKTSLILYFVWWIFIIHHADALIKCFDDFVRRIQDETPMATRCEYGMIHVEDEYNYWARRGSWHAPERLHRNANIFERGAVIRLCIYLLTVVDLETAMSHEWENMGNSGIADRLRQLESEFIKPYDLLMGRLQVIFGQRLEP